MNTPAVIITILAVMVAAYIMMAVNYKNKSKTVVIVTKPADAWPANKWAPRNLGRDPRMWTPTVYFKNNM
jgi:hypothetical protein